LALRGQAAFARLQQGVVAGGLQPLAGAALERQPLVHQPVVVGQRAFGVQAHAGFVGTGAAGQHQVVEEVLGAVVEAGRLLRRRAAVAAQVDVAAGQRGAAARGRRHFEDRHPGAGGLGLDRRTGARDAEADHGDIGFDVPAFDLVETQRARGGIGG
jgi:hypothetical protein